MKQILALLLMISLLGACRASFSSLGDASGISGAASEGSADATNRNNDDLPIGGEDPNQRPPGGEGGIDDDGGLEGIQIRIEETFGPNEDAACPGGGKRIIIGIDRNRDGQLDADEITSIEYICNDGTKPKCCCMDDGGKGDKDPGQNAGGKDPGQNDGKTCCCPAEGGSSDGCSMTYIQTYSGSTYECCCKT